MKPTALDKRAARASFASGTGTVAAFDALLSGLGIEGWHVIYSARRGPQNHPLYSVVIVGRGKARCPGTGRTLLAAITAAVDVLTGAG